MSDDREPEHSSAPPDPLLAALKALPIVRRRHPLGEFLFERGLSLRAGAKCVGMSKTNLARVVRTWRRPIEAERIAEGLGVPVGELFPVAEGRQRTDAEVEADMVDDLFTSLDDANERADDAGEDPSSA